MNLVPQCPKCRRLLVGVTDAFTCSDEYELTLPCPYCDERLRIRQMRSFHVTRVAGDEKERRNESHAT